MRNVRVHEEVIFSRQRQLVCSQSINLSKIVLPFVRCVSSCFFNHKICDLLIIQCGCSMQFTMMHISVHMYAAWNPNRHTHRTRLRPFQHFLIAQRWNKRHLIRAIMCEKHHLHSIVGALGLCCCSGRRRRTLALVPFPIHFLMRNRTKSRCFASTARFHCQWKCQRARQAAKIAPRASFFVLPNLLTQFFVFFHCLSRIQINPLSIHLECCFVFSKF
mmetsp:Transcript_22316/g.37836  ORF Transcript_22316/g.37836 Transcript_22316/m.37836 type:complete len:218 (-) Transcript_22316:45-698(-)